MTIGGNMARLNLFAQNPGNNTEDLLIRLFTGSKNGILESSYLNIFLNESY